MGQSCIPFILGRSLKLRRTDARPAGHRRVELRKPQIRKRDCGLPIGPIKHYVDLCKPIGGRRIELCYRAGSQKSRSRRLSVVGACTALSIFASEHAAPKRARLTRKKTGLAPRAKTGLVSCEPLNAINCPWV